MATDRPMPVSFFRLDSGREPTREWLRGLDQAAKQTIGQDVKTLQYGWPIGMPLAPKMEADLWELRSTLPNGIARLFFTLWDGHIVLLHGFIKKSQKTPKDDLALAKRRLTKLRST
jgi:phage-related protein